MPTAEKERLALYQQLNSTIGPDHAETLMQYLPPQKWADLATKEELRVTAKELRAEMTGLRAEMQAGFAMMESKFAQQTRTTVLALACFAASIWASMLATVLVIT